jgi:hypothetical protein
MPEVQVPANSDVVVVPVYVVMSAADTLTLPASPKVTALLDSWLRANHYVHDPVDDVWSHELLPEPVPFERAVGHCATLAA